MAFAESGEGDKGGYDATHTDDQYLSPIADTYMPGDVDSPDRIVFKGKDVPQADKNQSIARASAGASRACTESS